jgi:recombination protein RecA
MADAARAEIEALLRARKLDTTLTSAHPLIEGTLSHPDAGAALGIPADDRYVVATGIAALDARLGGGLARGQLSEIVGPRSSGRTSVVLSALAGAASRGEIVALVDTFDTFDPPSARACGLDLTRLLWVRGQAEAPCRPASDVRCPMSTKGGTWTSDLGLRTSDDKRTQAIDRALKAFNLILQAGGFGLVVLDLADASPLAIRRLPFTTWFRLQRPIEGSSTACVLVASEPVARSAGGVTITLRRVAYADAPHSTFDKCAGIPHSTFDIRHSATCWSSLFTGLVVEARLGRARGVAETCTFECKARP